ncbi:MAG: PAS domain S-box protein [Proteobacteria bacterium]|nr:PAS domain S-box protein [Pseudomonadota bacterium]MBU1387868.1 PAS domain S-box protein [Pseudomonadota bacterium]MBU1541351.1 PAS domain S-box protein [Pseudomonadota bacterium]MBU2482430.1 PAS domain S-box protein [Pseudomonadota bacterium]
MNQFLPQIELTALPGLVVLADPAGKIVYANNHFLKVLDTKKDDAVGQFLTSFWVPPYNKIETILEQIENEESFQTQILLHKKDGLKITVQCSFSKVPADEKNQFYILKIGQIISSSSDYAEIGRLRQELQQARISEESYRNIMESSPIAIALTRSSDARYMDVNEEWCRRTGFKKQDVLGKTSPELNVYRDLNVRKKLWDIFNKYGQVDDLELAFTNRFGENLYSLVSARKIQFMKEECLLYISTKIDALKKAEKKLAESEKSYRTTLDTAPYSIVVSRLSDGTYMQANKAFSFFSGYTEDEIIGKTPFDLGIYTDPNDRKRLVDMLSEKGRVDMAEVRFKIKDGTITDNIVSMCLLKFQDEDCILSIGVDVTERKAAETELMNYRKNLEKLVAERTRALEDAQKELVKNEKLAVLGQLTATVSHELRNPFGVIRSSVFYLQRKIRMEDEKIEKHLKRIDEQISLCDAIVDELLEYTQGRKAKPAVKNAAPWINKVIEQFKEDKGITIKLEIDKNLLPVAHDQEMMQRVLINLLNNSIHAVNEKSEKVLKENTSFRPEIFVQARQLPSGFNLTVCDNGIGMPENIRKKAFEPLFTTKARGTGIGLANVKKIITEHGGSIEIESDPGQGTTISIILKADGSS